MSTTCCKLKLHGNRYCPLDNVQEYVYTYFFEYKDLYLSKRLSRPPTFGGWRGGDGCSVSFAHLFGNWVNIFVWAIGGTLNKNMSNRGSCSVYQWWEKGSPVYGTTSKGALWMEDRVLTAKCQINLTDNGTHVVQPETICKKFEKTKVTEIESRRLIIWQSGCMGPLAVQNTQLVKTY